MMITAIVAIILVSPILSHMRMRFPMARGTIELNQQHQYPLDFNIKDPLPSPTLCKGKPAGPVSSTLKAGETINVQFEGTANHGGGICQFSVSYDNDKTFTVFKEIRGGCPDRKIGVQKLTSLETKDWPITLPKAIPSCEKCTFAWTWINAIGNREFYMNCADISITGGAPIGSSINGEKLLIGNLPGYPTIAPPGTNTTVENEIIQHPINAQSRNLEMMQNELNNNASYTNSSVPLTFGRPNDHSYTSIPATRLTPSLNLTPYAVENEIATTPTTSRYAHSESPSSTVQSTETPPPLRFVRYGC